MTELDACWNGRYTYGMGGSFSRMYLISRATPTIVIQVGTPVVQSAGCTRRPRAPSGVFQYRRASVSLTMATRAAAMSSVRAKSRPAITAIRSARK